MIPEDLFKRIQGFHFRTRRQANELFAGGYESAFKGRGMEFAEVREYQVGDDIRAIDWNVSARFGHPYVKVFHEERELTVMLVLDVSGSHSFGTRAKFKRELLAEVAGMLAFLAVRTNDKVGAILCSAGAEKFIPPKKGAAHVWRLIKEVFTYQPRDPRTNLDEALGYLNRVVKRHAIVFLISDCQDAGFEKSLRLTARKHELSVIRISDPAEEELPDLGWVTLRDPETGEVGMVDTGSRQLRERWRRHRRAQAASLAALLKKSGVDLVELSTGGPVVEPLLRLFEGRKRRIAV
jgi:uncharacterized protein (DUF58 family)